MINVIVSNSSPLIVIGKTGQLQLLKKLYKQILIPKEVYVEVVERGKEKKEQDAFLIDKAIHEGWIKVENLSKKEIQSSMELHKKFSISKGESEAIILAQRYKKCTLILDDLEAREIAKAENITLSDTLIVPLEALAGGKVSYEEFKKIFGKVIDVMKPKSDKIFKILEEAEKWKPAKI